MFLRLILLCLLLLLFSACRSETVPEVGEQQRQQILGIGGEAAKSLGSKLKEDLQRAMLDQGLVGAIQYCSDKAQEVTAQIQQGAPAGLEIKRVTDRARNSANKADEIDQQIINYFANQPLEQDSYQIKKVSGGYRFYKPLRIEGQCLACHGDPEQISGAVVQVLRSRYPEDKAVGYKLGDLRGLIRVFIPDTLIN